MLDDRIKLWQPGDYDMIGVPWHGLAQGPARGATGDYILTLPNGRQINMGPTTVGSDTRLYRDVRAVDPVLTEEQQAQATAAGAQWRADALLPNPHAGDWMYCDGEEGWRVSLALFTTSTVQRIVIEPMTTIGIDQDGSEYNDTARRAIEVTQLSTRPTYGTLFDLTGAGVIDITPDGSRALIARSALLGLYRSMTTELWECEITGPGATATATATLIWSYDDLIADYASTDTHPAGIQGYGVSGTPYWTLKTADDDGATLESAFEYEEVEVPIRGYEKPHTRIRTRSYENRVVSGYYKDGTIRLVKLELSVRTLRSVDSLTGPTVVEDIKGESYVGTATFSSTDYSWPPASSDTTYPRYEVETSLSGTLESRIEYVLKDDGVEVSRYEAVETGTHSQTIARAFTQCGFFNDARNFDGKVPAENYGGADESDAIASGTYSATHEIDLLQVHTSTNSESWTNGQTVQYSGYLADVPGVATIDKKRIWPITEESGVRVTAFPTKYNSGMSAIIVITETLSGSPATIVHRVGKIACRGEAIPGMFTFNGAQASSPGGFGLYGSYNAVTGERVRDTPGPCYYI